MEKMDLDLGHEHFLQFYSVLIQKNSKIKLLLFLVVFMLKLNVKELFNNYYFFSNSEFRSFTLNMIYSY